MANIVPRLSTWTLTPISNMSAAGAMAMSACCACASIRRTASDVPDSTHAWLTEPGHDIGRPHRQRRRRRPRASRCPPPRRSAVGSRSACCACIRSRRASIVGSRTIAGWLSVCPPESASAVTSSAIGIRAAHSACSGVISPAATSSRRILRRRRRQELRGHLDPRHLGDDPVRRHDLPRGVAVDAVHAVAHDRQRQVEIRRGLDQPHPAPQVEVDHRLFQGRLARAVDQVEAVARPRAPSSARAGRSPLPPSPAAAPPRRRTRACRRGPSPRRSPPSRSRWPSPPTCRDSGAGARRRSSRSPRCSSRHAGR